LVFGPGCIGVAQIFVHGGQIFFSLFSELPKMSCCGSKTKLFVPQYFNFVLSLNYQIWTNKDHRSHLNFIQLPNSLIARMQVLKGRTKYFCSLKLQQTSYFSLHQSNYSFEFVEFNLFQMNQHIFLHKQTKIKVNVFLTNDSWNGKLSHDFTPVQSLTA
jgi:hypothetical protein